MNAPAPTPAPAGRATWRSSDGVVQVAVSEVADGDLGRNTRAPAAQVLAARATLSAAWSLPSIVDARQVHGTQVHVAGTDGQPGDWSRPVDEVDIEADAIVVPAGVEAGAAVLVADCVPAVLVAGTSFAVVHAGWRGAVAGVVEQAVVALLAVSSDPAGDPVAMEQVEAVLGPAICPDCFEVGDDVAAQFHPHDVIHGSHSGGGLDDVASGGLGTAAGARVDLAGAIERRLRALGIQRVARIGGCTKCDAARRWHSFRRDGAAAGRIAMVAWRP